MFVISMKWQCGHASMSKNPTVYIRAQCQTSTTTVSNVYQSGYEGEDVEAEVKTEEGYDANDERGDAAVT